MSGVNKRTGCVGFVMGFALATLVVAVFSPAEIVVQPGLTVDQAVAAGHGELILGKDGVTAFRWNPSPHVLELKVVDLEAEVYQLQAEAESNERAFQNTREAYRTMKSLYGDMEGTLMALRKHVKTLEEENFDLRTAGIELIVEDPPEEPKEERAPTPKKEEAEPKPEKRWTWPWKRKETK